MFFFYGIKIINITKYIYNINKINEKEINEIDLYGLIKFCHEGWTD